MFLHNALIINISRTAAEKDIYDAVRGTWKLDPRRARAVDVVLAALQGLIVGVFVADEWMPAGDRWEFVGRNAPLELTELYLRRRLPESMRPRGAANPVRYVQPG